DVRERGQMPRNRLGQTDPLLFDELQSRGRGDGFRHGRNGKHRVRLDRDTGWIASAECRLIEHGVLARHHGCDGRYSAMRNAAAQRLIEAPGTASGSSSKDAWHMSTGRRSESSGGELSPGDDTHSDPPSGAVWTGYGSRSRC